METTAYKITSLLIRIFSKKPQIHIPSNLDLNEPVVFVANHERLAGPIMMDTYFPYKFRPWIIFYMLEKKEIREYVRETFFSGRHKMKYKISDLYARILTPLIHSVMNSTNPVPVYLNQRRIGETFQLSIEALKNRQNLLIFPEKKGEVVPQYRHIFNFQAGIIHLAKQYFRETRQKLPFIPVSINPNAHWICIGNSVVFNPEVEYEDEKTRVIECLMRQIEQMYTPPQSAIH